jgi:hypothetical protein
MAQQRVTVDERTPLILLIIDAIAFWLRNQPVFWLLALPIAGLAAAGSYLVGTVQQFAFLSHPESWHFLFALIYAMFLDRWIKESLLDGAEACEGVDELRRALVPTTLLMFTILFFVFAMILSLLRLQGIGDTLFRWGVPFVAIAPLASFLAWLPHVLLWSTVLAFLALLAPASSAATRMSPAEAWRLAAPVRPKLFRLILGATLLSLAVGAASVWGVEVLPKKAWVPAALIGVQRLVDCLLLAIVGHVLAVLFSALADWHPPEPEERPFRHMKLKARSTPR